jgi:hypothetical protein
MDGGRSLQKFGVWGVQAATNWVSSLSGIEKHDFIGEFENSQWRKARFPATKRTLFLRILVQPLPDF